MFPLLSRSSVAVWLIAGGLCLCGCSQQRPEPELQIVNTLNAQADAWNRGDLDGFMEPYWESDELTFCAGGNTTHGRTELLARYEQKYGRGQAMGRLEFTNLRIRFLGRESALVLGEWALMRDDGPLGGNFSLVFQYIDNRWTIVHDHTSATPAATD